MQQTLRDSVRFSGVGLHTGSNINLKVLPAPENTGIVFVRKDIRGSLPIKAHASNVVATNYATSIGCGGVTVSTVEHLLSAFYGLGVDNAIVELDGPEVPIMDGSASLFVEKIESIGLEAQYSPRMYLVVTRPVKVIDGDKYILLMPSPGNELTINYSIDFQHPFLAKQSFSSRFSRDIFRNEIGDARTFGFLRDVEMLRANGLAKGGSPSNAIVIGDNEILNEGGLRYPDEFVRHKVLDLMGDISLAGAPIIGHIVAHKSGHALNHKLIKELAKRPLRWVLAETPFKEEAHGRRHTMAAAL